jgi:hypothetical protein
MQGTHVRDDEDEEEAAREFVPVDEEPRHNDAGDEEPHVADLPERQLRQGIEIGSQA